VLFYIKLHYSQSYIAPIFASMLASSSNLDLRASLASTSFFCTLSFMMALGALLKFASIEATLALKLVTSANIFLCCCNKAAFSGAIACCVSWGDSALMGGEVTEFGGLACMGVMIGDAAANVGCGAITGITGWVTGGIGITSTGCERCKEKGIGIDGGGNVTVGGEVTTVRGDILIGGGETAAGGGEKFVVRVVAGTEPAGNSTSGALGLCRFFLCFLSFSFSVSGVWSFLGLGVLGFFFFSLCSMSLSSPSSW